MKRLFLIFTFSFSFIILKSQENITIEELWKNYSFSQRNFGKIKVLKNSDSFTRLESNKELQQIVKYSFTNGKKELVIFDSQKFKLKNRIRSYKFSHQENYLIIETDRESIYRYSYKSKCLLYDIQNDKIYDVFDEKIQNLSFSPDEKFVSFTFENNIYINEIQNILNGNISSFKKITSDGKNNSIINGSSDWVYEEEFGLVQAYQWSPDGKKIAYLKFDEENVNTFSMDIFKGQLYPSSKTFKYPKAGEDNSVVNLYIHDLEENKTKFIYTEKDYEYIPRFFWTFTSNKLVFYGLNRLQNNLDFIVLNYENLETEILFSENDSCYIEIKNELEFFNENHFIWISEKDGYYHAYLKNLEGFESQLTKGNWEIKEIYGFDSDLMKLYYSSNEEGTETQSLFSLDIEYDFKEKISTKLGFNDAIFSHSLKNYISYYSNANRPYQISLNKADGSEIMIFENNQLLIDKLSKYKLNKKEFFKIQTDNTELDAWIIKPTNFDENKKYPVMMFVYGGPGSKEVLDKWEGNDFLWHQYLSQNGIIIVSVDNRGTGGKGASFRKVTYKNLGKYETIDIVDAAKFLSKFNYVDEKRIGIQGWSYGGYLSSLAITKGSSIFDLSVAIAPVTNWRFYDNIYTERYMSKPVLNSDGYDQNSPINFVSNLRGKYLLVHGTADDNVHVQNTYEMVSALVNKNKEFELFIYPDKNHGIYGGNTRFHLYNKITNFILENL